MTPNIEFLHCENCQETQEDLNKMQQKIKENPDVLELRDELSKDTPLVNAILRGHEKCIKFLVQNGSNINGYKEGTNALHRTYFKYQNDTNSRILYVKILTFLLKSGSSPTFVKRSNGRQEKSLITRVVLQNDFELACLFLKYGAQPYLNTENCDINVRFVKALFLYHGKLSLEIENNEYNEAFVSYLLQFKFPKEIESKLKALRILHKFGINLWRHGIEEDCNDDIFIAEVRKLRESPMSLKYLSRIATVRSMDTKYLSNYSRLEIPKELLSFLEFRDV
jgi:ankyrin repeat protein